ncbi:MAG: hypothetical protein V1656_00730, partial [Candidatus Jorgensenbacteria bacterium]
MHKISIHTLKLFFRFIRRTREFFAGIGVAFVAALLTVGVIALVWWGLGVARQFVEERIQHALVSRVVGDVSPVSDTDVSDRGAPVPVVPRPEPAEGPPPAAVPPGLVSGSISDLFSGVGWVNQEKTTMFHDRSATAFLFPPVFAWEKASNAETLTDPQPCITSRCLETRDNKLFLNGDGVAFPAEVPTGTIMNVSVGALETKWAVGVVARAEAGLPVRSPAEEGYDGYLYLFDGKTFRAAGGADSGRLFSSPYAGTFGFGGLDGDWLAVYGAYEGRAYHFLEGKPAENASRFFGIRIMSGGFLPRVIRVPSSHYSLP